jgi:hypothetical protein
MSLSPAEMQALLNGPAALPPPGVTPNFTDPYNFKSALLIIQIIFLILPTLAVAIRFYAKVWLIRSTHLEDCEFINYVLY